MPSIKIVLRKTKLHSNKFPIYLRVTHLRKSKHFRTPFNSTIKEWNNKTGEFNSKHENSTQNNRVLNKFKSKVLKIINNFEIDDKDFSFSALEKELRLFSNPLQNDVFVFFDTIIKEMVDSGRIGTSKVNKETSNSLKKFNKGSTLAFEALNADYLYRYEVHLRKRGGTSGGIGVKMRTIRAIYNLAINRDLIKEANYPFKIYKISKLKGSSIKRALGMTDITIIETFDYSTNPHLLNARNYFIFSFYTRGMNFTDMMKLKWDNISKERIYYTRSKTNYNFSIKIIDPIKDILTYYKNSNPSTQYVFPILLKENLTPSQIDNRKHKVLKQFNTSLKEIRQLCDISHNITSYVARHSYATCMRKKGVSDEVISASLGHQELSTTKAYLKSFEDFEVDEACDLLLTS
ncbi:site-specific integrase [Formosa sp. PL04]|uniref:site-specific integrase n=1 Tax=Formosa sp. PL04 TaxID=3081755 RepID=UPI0029811D02|nr:site-specific integrase [Formosa sp. PL04]MDW5289159.1 site-specific integrase [Formosa sp. PL04]